MKLSAWARNNGLSYKTAWRLWKTGQLPLPTEQLPTGTILVHEIPTQTSNSVLYTRVCSGDEAADLERQLQRLRDFAAVRGLRVVQEIREIGSGLNGRRKKLLKILENPSISILVVEHRDRLARFGSEYIESALKAANRIVVVANDTEMRDDLVQDMVDVLTWFCARLYGKRAARNRAKRAIEATQG
jgi:predicted site-specific integrase-resolvase